MKPTYKTRKIFLGFQQKENQPLSFWPPLYQEKLFTSMDTESIWTKYCGFLDLSITEFMDVQRLLLMEQIELAMNTMLGQNIIGDKKPKNIIEFRKMVPLTRYVDYQKYLDNKDSNVLSGTTYYWARSSGRTGPAKLVPYSINTLNTLANDTISALILSSTNKKGEVHLNPGDKIAIDFPSPSIAEVVRKVLYQRLVYRPIFQVNDTESLNRDEIYKRTLLTALEYGVSYLGIQAEELTRMSSDLIHIERNLFSFLKWHPRASIRISKAIIKSKIKKQPILPKDILKIKGLIFGRNDTSFSREKIYNDWGINPLEVYFSAETAFIGMQGWNKKGLTLLPQSQFYEFIPEN
jgi:hypothetical protein